MIDPTVAAAYLPSDRRRALARGVDLPATAAGFVLFADIAGFTPLTGACVDALGPTRGVEVATRHLNAIYDALIGAIHHRGGSIVGYSGDGMLCWFAQDDNGPAGAARAARAAWAAATALHAALTPFARVPVTAEVSVPIGLKIAVAGGRVRRIVAGDPAIQLIDVLAGPPVDAVSEGERLAQRAESLFEAAVVGALGLTAEAWRESPSGYRFAALPAPGDNVANTSHPDGDEPTMAALRPWLLPSLAQGLAAGRQEYLAELRPTVALFLRFAGMDFVHDEDVAAKLAAFVAWVQQIVTKAGGALLQLTTGDKGSYVYASFGATQVHTDDAVRAAAAGLELLAYRRVAPWLSDVRIGIAGGRTRVGPYGGTARCTFGAQGAAVNTAARLMSFAAADSIVVAATIADAIRVPFALESLSYHTLKGAETASELYRLIGRRDPGKEPDVESSRAPLCGRSAELARLIAALDAACAGQGGRVALAGPPGIGKSRLAAEAAQRAAELGARTQVVRGESTTQDIAYAAIAPLLRSLLQVASADSPAAAAEAVAAWFARHAPEWQTRVALVRDALRVPLPESPLTSGLNAQQRQDALAHLVSDLVVHACGEQPILLIVEDYQHVDEASRAVLAAVGRRAMALPLLLLVCARMGDAPDGAAFETGELLTLPPLTAQETTALIAARLGKPADGLTAEIVVHLAQGNPAFVLALADALVEAGHIADQGTQWAIAPAYFQTLREARKVHYGGDGWRLSPAVSVQAGLPGLPVTLQGILLDRIDRLGDAAKLTLKIASVVGRTFEVDVLAAVDPRREDADPLARRLQEWAEAGVLVSAEAQASTSVTYAFRESILQEALYQSLLETQQRALHTAVGRALETVAPQAVERLARHFAAADLAQPETRQAAIHYLALAAAKSRRENANETARHFLTQLLPLAPTWPTYRSLTDVLHLLGRREEEAATLATARSLPDVDPGDYEYLRSCYLEAVARYDEAWAAAGAALRHATTGDEIATIQVQMARIAGREGDYRKEEERYQAALAALSSDPNPAAQTLIDVYYGLGTVRKQQGDYAGALDVLTVALELAAREQRAAEQARVLMAMGVVSRMQRAFGQARAYTEQALALRREIGDRSGEGDTLFSLAQVVIHGVGDYGQGRDLLNQALSIQRGLGNRWSQAIVLNELGVVHYLIGLHEEAERVLRDVQQLCHAIGAAAGLVYVQWNLGLVLREQGRFEEAQAALKRALHDAAALDDPHVTAQLTGELALTELTLGAAAAALAHAQTAITALEQLGLEVMIPADRATAAQAALLQGDHDAARRHARAALAILDACQGEGPDFPHREYRRCSAVLAACGDSAAAAAAAAQAQRLLDRRAAAISDPELRAVFLTRSPGCTAVGFAAAAT